jgi:hypothetical protein
MWDKYKFRCSKLGSLMTEPKAKKDLLSVTTKSYLDDLYIRETKGREKDIMNKYMMKGLMVEEDSISLVTSVTKKFFIKNQERFENEWIAGTPDLVRKDEVIDIKSSWDIWTYGKAEVTKDNYWQMMGYMWLTGLESGSLYYCLVDAPEQLIQDELRKLSWKMMMIDPIDPLYQEAEAKIRKGLVFDDIPDVEKVKVFTVKYNQEDIDKLIERIAHCREYLNQKKGI